MPLGIRASAGIFLTGNQAFSLDISSPSKSENTLSQAKNNPTSKIDKKMYFKLFIIFTNNCANITFDFDSLS